MLLCLSSPAYAAAALSPWRFSWLFLIFGVFLYFLSFAITLDGRKKMLFYLVALRLTGAVWLGLSVYRLDIPGVFICGAVGMLAPAVLPPLAVRLFNAEQAIFVSDPKGIKGSITYSPRFTSIAATFLLYAMYGHIGSFLVIIVFFDALLKSSELLTQIIFGIDLAGLISVLAYFAKLRIIVSPESITKETLFGSTTVALTETARVKYGVIGVGMRRGRRGPVVASEFNAMGIIENGGKRINIGRYIRNSEEIIEILKSLETEKITPYLLEAMRSGKSVDSGRLTQTLDTVTVKVKEKIIHKPLNNPRYEGERLIIKAVKDDNNIYLIRKSDVWNPEATLELLRYIDIAKFDQQRQAEART